MKTDCNLGRVVGKIVESFCIEFSVGYWFNSYCTLGRRAGNCWIFGSKPASFPIAMRRHFRNKLSKQVAPLASSFSSHPIKISVFWPKSNLDNSRADRSGLPDRLQPIG